MPKDYYDFRNPKNIKDIELDKMECFIATVTEIKVYDKMLKIIVKDSIGTKLDIVFFNMMFLRTVFESGKKYIFCGKITIPKNFYVKQCVNPIFSEDISKYKRILPVYSKIKGMSDDYLLKTIEQALSGTPSTEYLSMDILKHFLLHL